MERLFSDMRFIPFQVDRNGIRMIHLTVGTQTSTNILRIGGMPLELLWNL